MFLFVYSSVQIQQQWRPETKVSLYFHCSVRPSRSTWRAYLDSRSGTLFSTAGDLSKDVTQCSCAYSALFFAHPAKTMVLAPHHCVGFASPRAAVLMTITIHTSQGEVVRIGPRLKCGASYTYRHAAGLWAEANILLGRVDESRRTKGYLDLVNPRFMDGYLRL